MLKVQIFRYMYESDDQGTPGDLIMKGFHCVTLELPWRDNKTSMSCIPSGEYQIKIGRASRRIGGRYDLYLLENTLPRTGIFIHAGNFAGDKSLGYETDSYGCPLLGSSHTIMNNQKAISNSRNTVKAFMDALNYHDAILEIIET